MVNEIIKQYFFIFDFRVYNSVHLFYHFIVTGIIVIALGLSPYHPRPSNELELSCDILNKMISVKHMNKAIGSPSVCFGVLIRIKDATVFQ